MTSFQLQANQRRKRGRRTTTDSVVSVRYSGCYSNTFSYSSEENETGKEPCKRRLSLQDILALLDEQKVFREELEEVHRTNFNLDNLLSNCALKVEDFNRKLLLVEYELSDFKEDKMKWEKKDEKYDENFDDLPRNIPLRRSNRKIEPYKGDIPKFDDGRHKLEKYAKIHGIVDVEIELYSSDDQETDDEEEAVQEKHESSENTFSFGDSNNLVNTADVLCESPVENTNSQYVDNKRVELEEEELEEEEEDEEEERAKLDAHSQPVQDTPNNTCSCHDNTCSCHNTCSHHDNTPPGNTSPIKTPDSLQRSTELEYSLVDADDDIFSNSIDSTDTIEQIKIVLNNDSNCKAFNSNNTCSCHDNTCNSIARTKDAARVAMATTSSGTSDTKIGTNSTVDSSTLVDAKYTVDTGVGEYSYVGCEDAGTDTMPGGAGLMGNWVADIFKQYDIGRNKTCSCHDNTCSCHGNGGRKSKGDEDGILVGDGGEEFQPTKAAAEDTATCSVVMTTTRVVVTTTEAYSEKNSRESRESEEIDRLLAELDITEDDVLMAYHTPTIKIETGVEDGAQLLREHKDDVSEDRTPSNSILEGAISDAISNASVYEFEDSDEERRKRRRGRPFRRRVARGFFARLCACWHN